MANDSMFNAALGATQARNAVNQNAICSQMKTPSPIKPSRAAKSRITLWGCDSDDSCHASGSR